MRPVDRGQSPRTFTKYKQARPYLIKQIGAFCSYCERQVTNQLAVEHILPKEHNKHLKLTWENFLLACTNCNSIKGHTDISLADYYWPDRDNTSRAFTYQNGIVSINNNLDDPQKILAQRTLELTGLDRIPGSKTKKPTAYDLRWLQRQEVWNKAQRAFGRLRKHNTVAMREQIIETAQADGFWSIWMTVFSADLDMLRRLIAAFPGRCNTCFDAEFRPIPRPGGAL